MQILQWTSSFCNVVSSVDALKEETEHEVEQWVAATDIILAKDWREAALEGALEAFKEKPPEQREQTMEEVERRRFRGCTML